MKRQPTGKTLTAIMATPLAPSVELAHRDAGTTTSSVGRRWPLPTLNTDVYSDSFTRWLTAGLTAGLSKSEAERRAHGFARAAMYRAAERSQRRAT